MIHRERIWKGFWALTILAAFAAGCGDDDGGTKPGGSEITFPLATGNTWSYAVEVTEGGGTDTYAREDEVTGTDSVDGQIYYELQSSYAPALRRALRGTGLLRDRLEEKALQPDSSSVLLRQEGQKLYLYLQFDTSGLTEEYLLWVYGQLNASAPWEIADFASSSGSAKTLLHAEQTFEVQGTPLTAEVDVTASNQGRTSVTVPKGTYTDVYRGRFVINLVFTEDAITPITVTFRLTQDLWVKDGVGIVQETAEDRVEVTGSPAEIETMSARMTDFTLQR